jgi:nucleoside-diphosphate-sugar epimerase
MTGLRCVLVTGAAGGVGRSVCDALIREGFAVRALIRPEDDRAAVKLSDDSVVLGLVEDAASVERAMHGADAVVHCAALLPSVPGVSVAQYLDVNRGGTETVLRTALRQQIKAATFFSTISVVDHNARKIDRASVCEYVEPGNDAYLASKIAAEQCVLAERDSFPGRLAVIRPGFVYGPGAMGVWRQPLRLVMRGQMALIGGGRVGLPLAYADDIAAYVVALLRGTRYAPPYDIHVVANPEPTTIADVFTFIADYLGAPRPRSLPRWPLTIGAAICDVLPKSLRVGPLAMLTKARLRQYSMGYDLSRLLDHPLLSKIQMTNYRVGLSRMLDEYLAQQAGS